MSQPQGFPGHHFCCIALVEQVTETVQIQEEGDVTLFSMGVAPKMFNLPSLIYHTLQAPSFYLAGLVENSVR